MWAARHTMMAEWSATPLLPSPLPIGMMSEPVAVPEHKLRVSSTTSDDERARWHAAAAVGVAHRGMSDGTAVPQS